MLGIEKNLNVLSKLPDEISTLPSGLKQKQLVRDLTWSDEMMLSSFFGLSVSTVLSNTQVNVLAAQLEFASLVHTRGVLE